MRAVSFLLLAGLIMNATEVEAQEKKELVAPYKEFVTVRKWSENDKRFQNPHKDVMAYKVEVKGFTIIYLRSADSPGRPEPKSEIIMADGTVYVIDKAEGGQPTRSCFVTKKPDEKK